jgi:hypothetical protein
VVAELRAHRRSGLGRLLTEDTVRFAVARALVGAGWDAAGLSVEWPHPVLTGSRVDLVAGGMPPTALIEFKFPREPNEKNAAWTMALGEVLKDFYRLAVCPGPVDRLFVYVETARLRRYMAGAAMRYGLGLDVDRVALRSAEAAQLPTTAAQKIGADLAANHVTAERIESMAAGRKLRPRGGVQGGGPPLAPRCRRKRRRFFPAPVTVLDARSLPRSARCSPGPAGRPSLPPRSSPR